MTRRAESLESPRQTQLRRWLLEERHRLQHAAQSQRRELQAAAEDEALLSHDAAGASDVSVQSDLAFGLLQLRTEMLSGIDEALERLEREDYGRCMDCSRDIPLSRLRALPFAVRCVTCAEEIEDLAARPTPSPVHTL